MRSEDAPVATTRNGGARTVNHEEADPPLSETFQPQSRQEGLSMGSMINWVLRSPNSEELRTRTLSLGLEE